ncbi:MAG: hypothetical protein H6856_07950 [Rhodospirillales bacterium]|nr:hypothetical protein [Rhodospirillales bacterium]
MGIIQTVRFLALALAMVAVFLLSPLGVSFAAEESTGEAVSADKLIADRGADEKKEDEEAKADENKKAPAQQPKQDPSTLKKRLELAQKMHEIRPTRDQVESAIRRASESVPPAEREAFMAAMTTVLNYKAIERISVDAMAEVFTVEELESMVEYYSKPEAKSASAKIRDWIALVQPEINRIIDKAMMRVRTGAPN